MSTTELPATTDLPQASLATDPLARVVGGLRHGVRRAGAVGRFALGAPASAARTVATTPPAELASRARDLVAPTPHPLSTPPRGLRAIPGSAGVPLLQGARGLTGDRVAWGLAERERYGPVSWTALAGKRVVNVTEPDMVSQILINRDKDFSNDGWQELIGRFFDRGLMLLSFDEHLDHRRIMQSAFTPRRLDGYLAGMDARISADLASRWPTDGQVPVYPRMKDLAMRVAADVFLGLELDDEQRASLLDGFHAQARAGTETFRLDVPFTLWGRGRNGYDDVTAFFRAELERKRERGGDDLFAAMVHAEDADGARFTDDEIVRHMNFLWFAAHDTTTLAMAMMAWAFAAHPDWQDRAHEESAAVGDGPLHPDDLDRLEAIGLVMDEVMRLWPPVPAMMRRAVRDADLQGYHVPEGTWLHVMSPVTHRLAGWWEDPHTFDPSRFEAPREEHKAHKHVYYPFGAGAHKCIGFAFAQLETKAMWHRLLLSRRFSVEPGYQPPVGWKALPEPLDGLPVRISPR